MTRRPDDYTIPELEALLEGYEPANVTGFVPVRAIRQLIAVKRERDALKGAVRQMALADPTIGAEWFRSAAKSLLVNLDVGEMRQ